MKQEKDLKQTLIQHYSILSRKNPFELTERINEKEWWVKETYRLKMHSLASKIGFGFILLILSSYMVSGYKHSGSFWNITIPVTSILIFLVLIRAFSRVEERVRLFAVMKLVFVEKEEVADAML